MNSATLTLWTGPFQIKGVSGWFLLLPCFIDIPVLNANSVDPDQMQCSATSDLGLHSLLVSLLGKTKMGLKKSLVVESR